MKDIAVDVLKEAYAEIGRLTVVNIALRKALEKAAAAIPDEPAEPDDDGEAESE